MENKKFCDSQAKQSTTSDDSMGSNATIFTVLDACIRGSQKILDDSKKRSQFRKIYRRGKLEH